MCDLAGDIMFAGGQAWLAWLSSEVTGSQHNNASKSKSNISKSKSDAPYLYTHPCLPQLKCNSKENKPMGRLTYFSLQRSI